jgi:hypothetical protein
LASSSVGLFCKKGAFVRPGETRVFVSVSVALFRGNATVALFRRNATTRPGGFASPKHDGRDPLALFRRNATAPNSGECGRAFRAAAWRLPQQRRQNVLPRYDVA